MSEEIKNDELDGQAKGEAGEKSGEDEFEKVCFVCRRPESKAGKMITMPGNITICSDCMQKAFDSFSRGGNPYGLTNIPGNGQGGVTFPPSPTFRGWASSIWPIWESTAARYPKTRE